LGTPTKKPQTEQKRLNRERGKHDFSGTFKKPQKKAPSLPKKTQLSEGFARENVTKQGGRVGEQQIGSPEHYWEGNGPKVGCQLKSRSKHHETQKRKLYKQKRSATRRRGRDSEISWKQCTQKTGKKARRVTAKRIALSTKNTKKKINGNKGGVAF